MTTLMRTWLDDVFDNLDAQGPAQGETRGSHAFGWVSAFHVLTERVIDKEMDICSGRHNVRIAEHKPEYDCVRRACHELAELGLVKIHYQYRDFDRPYLIEVIK